MSFRVEKVSSLLKTNIARILREDLGNPRLSSITITRIDLTGDLKRATVFFSAISGDPEALTAELDHAKGYIRKQLSRKIIMKSVPALVFVPEAEMDAGDYGAGDTGGGA